MTEQSMPHSSGVQDLIERIRDEGIKSSQEEADRLLEAARKQAARLVADAEAEVAALREQTRAQIESDNVAAREALRLAARDASLELGAVVVNTFERQVKNLVTDVTWKPEFLEALVLVLAGHAVEEFIKDKQIQILASSVVLGESDDPEIEQRARRGTLIIASEMLREGIELIPADDVQGGVRVRIVDEDLEVDLSCDAISRLLLRHMLPRFRAIMTGAE